jgi:hypothetical protein
VRRRADHYQTETILLILAQGDRRIGRQVCRQLADRLGPRIHLRLRDRPRRCQGWRRVRAGQARAASRWADDGIAFRSGARC